MYCLFNGEKGEHDLSYIGGINSIIKNQSTNYPKWVGVVIGDFTVLGVEYDWGKRDQRWHIKCNHCGEESYLYHATDWRRGKGRSTKCHCQKITREKKKTEKKLPIDYSNHPMIGEVIGEYRIIEYVPRNKFRVECIQCGKQRLYSSASVLKGHVDVCNHVVTNNYSDSKYIGMRNGHLTAVSYEGKCFIAKCDCGKTVTVRGTDLFRNHSVTRCGDEKCPYTHESSQRNEIRLKGIEYEHKAAEYFKSLGYRVDKTPDSGDFGVDLIMYSGDRKIAIQCKRQKAPANVSAVQQVYAGGRFYDCNNFLVISPSGFTANAITMASKLGVLLAQNRFTLEDFDRVTENCVELKDTLPLVVSRREYKSTIWTIDGITKSANDWCIEYGVNRSTVDSRIRRGMSPKEALSLPISNNSSTVYEAYGYKGTIAELAARFNILASTVRYRMKYRGMSIEEALTAPKNVL